MSAARRPSQAGDAATTIGCPLLDCDATRRGPYDLAPYFNTSERSAEAKTIETWLRLADRDIDEPVKQPNNCVGRIFCRRLSCCAYERHHVGRAQCRELEPTAPHMLIAHQYDPASGSAFGQPYLVVGRGRKGFSGMMDNSTLLAHAIQEGARINRLVEVEYRSLKPPRGGRIRSGSLPRSLRSRPHSRLQVPAGYLPP